MISLGSLTKNLEVSDERLWVSNENLGVSNENLKVSDNMAVGVSDCTTMMMIS